jgi:hypothetical protein
MVMAGLVPASPLNKAPPCHIIGVAGTSRAMTDGVGAGISFRVSRAFSFCKHCAAQRLKEYSDVVVTDR